MGGRDGGAVDESVDGYKDGAVHWSVGGHRGGALDGSVGGHRDGAVNWFVGGYRCGDVNGLAGECGDVVDVSDVDGVCGNITLNPPALPMNSHQQQSQPFDSVLVSRQTLLSCLTNEPPGNNPPAEIVEVL